MSSLIKPIKFRYLAQQLTSTELSQFLSKWFDKSGKETILNWLFLHFTKDINSSNNKNDVDNTIEIISNIIRARKDKPSQSQIVNISELNSNLLGKVGSFLNQIEYTRFSVCCRSILIGCNSPNTLQNIDLDSFNTPYSMLNLPFYPSIKYVEFQPPSTDKCNFVGRWNNLEHFRFKKLFFSLKQMTTFMQNPLIQFDKIKKLDLIIPKNYTNPGNLMEFFSKFKMIERLHLNEHFSVNATLTRNDLFPNLKSIWSNGSRFSNAIINTYSNQLQGLQFTDNAVFAFENDTKFDKLNELTIWNANKNNIEHILKTAKKLSKIRISLNFKKNDLLEMIRKIIFSQHLLQYFEINTSTLKQKFINVFNGMEKGLFQMTKKQKIYFKIKIKIECKHEINLNDLMIYISRIKTGFQFAKVKDFMLLCVLFGSKKPQKDAVNCMVEDYCESTAVMCSYYENDNCTIVLTNRFCKINGYSESWL